MFEQSRYWYAAKVLKIVDGDTVDFEIDLGFRILTRQRVRLFGIDTPELRDKDKEKRAAAKKAKKWLRDRLENCRNSILIHSTAEQGKYGRWIVTVYDSASGENINEIMVRLGLAERYPKK